jgi:hypothetical protein
MKNLLFLLAGLRLATAAPQLSSSDHHHGTMTDDHEHPTTASTAVSVTRTSGSASPSASPTGSAPAGCKLLSTDATWPARTVWEAALHGATPGNDTTISNRPDYIMIAENVAGVQAAVRFVAQHNIRLSIVNSGHDFLGR